MSDRIYNVHFLCIGTIARSVLAEGILRTAGDGRQIGIGSLCSSATGEHESV